jgi:2-succinyl-5-enolpyruvyl-6-hydroxy-3-cyclohexene-1-carboxylate synthase
MSNLHTLWADLLIDSLVAAGVREAVVSPGSRSTPLALAAARHSRLGHHVIIDERSAGFFALGQVHASDTPSLLICTSGSAGAHYAPAVVEAAEANVPLIVVTADRPPELQQRQAAQTTGQSGLFAGHLRAFFELGVPDADERALAGLRSTAAMAVARSRDPRPGPVHLNAPFRKPLEPVAETPADGPVRAIVERLKEQQPTRLFPAKRLPDPVFIDILARTCRSARRGLLLAGPAPLSASGSTPLVRALAARLGFPLLAEAASQHRFAGHDESTIALFEHLTPELVPTLVPELVIQLGAPLGSASWGRYIEQGEGPRRFVIAPHGFPDPANNAAAILSADLDVALFALLDALGEVEPGDPAWLARWHNAEQGVVDVLAEQEMAALTAGELDEALAARTVVRAAPPGSLLQLANSLAIREVDQNCPTDAAELGVLSQKGVNGIDGAISSAAGAASVAGRPVTALLGDVACLHDIGGLAAAARVDAPLALVVLHNRGGRLFELLPLADGAVEQKLVDELFLTTHELSFEGAASTFGVPFVRVHDRDTLTAAVRNAHERAGVTLIEVAIHGRSVRDRHTAVRTAVQARLVRADA